MPNLPIVQDADPLGRATPDKVPRIPSGWRVYCAGDSAAVGKVTGAGGGTPRGEALQVSTGWWHRIVRKVPPEGVETATGGRVQLRMSRQEFLDLAQHLPDQEIVDRVRDSFRAFPPFRQSATASIAVTCSDGALTLSGNVAHEGHRVQALRCVERVDGVGSLSDRLISDEQLVSSLTRSFLTHPALQPSLVRVSARLGRVTLEGEVASAQLVALVSTSAWQVPGVAALDNRLSVRPAPAPPDVFAPRARPIAGAVG
jgi:osmotically-inducible protein OsmY